MSTYTNTNKRLTLIAKHAGKIGAGVAVIMIALYAWDSSLAKTIADILLIGSLCMTLYILLKSRKAPTDAPHNQKPGNELSPVKESIANLITDRLDSGIMEDAINKRMDKMIDSVVDDLFGNYGDVTRTVQSKLKDTMTPIIERYDFSEHAVKMELVLDSMVKAAVGPNKQIAENFQTLMGTAPIQTIKMSEILDHYGDIVAKDIDTSELDINEDDTPRYSPTTITLESEDDSFNSFGLREVKQLNLECEDDDQFNLNVTVVRWKEDSLSESGWRIDSFRRTREEKYNFPKDDDDITQLSEPFTRLRDLSTIEAYLLKLYQERTLITLDVEDESIEIEIEIEPEYSLS